MQQIRADPVHGVLRWKFVRIFLLWLDLWAQSEFCVDQLRYAGIGGAVNLLSAQNVSKRGQFDFVRPGVGALHFRVHPNLEVSLSIKVAPTVNRMQGVCHSLTLRGRYLPSVVHKFNYNLIIKCNNNTNNNILSSRECDSRSIYDGHYTWLPPVVLIMLIWIQSTCSHHNSGGLNTNRAAGLFIGPRSQQQRCCS